MKKILCLSVGAAALLLTSCGKKEVVVLPADTVGLRITSEVPSALKAQRISVIPNDVAPWLSHILLLSDGNLYRTTANGGKAQAVNGGRLKDIAGLMRKGEAGTVLTLTTDGKLTAMIEKDDEGRLARMNVSSKAESYDGFCQNAEAPTDTVTAFTGRTLITLNIGYEGDDLMTVTETGRSNMSKAITSCFLSGETVYAVANDQLFAGGKEAGNIPKGVSALSGIAGKTAPTLLYVQGNTTLLSSREANPKTQRKVIIQDGLRVIGSSEASNVFVTSNSLGSTFSEGAVIVQDATSERLIMVTLPMARKELNKLPAK